MEMKSPSNIPEFTIGEIAQLVKRTIEGNFERVRLRGEISGLSRPASGHVYFKLKDTDAAIDAVAWKFTVPKLGLKPEDGIEVIATGKLTTYPAGSRYQIVVDTMELAGAGALLKLLEERKKKLQAEGLFDPARKKSLPFLPSSIGIITSPTGAVIRDILHRLADRFPLPVWVWPTTVQGAGTASAIVQAIAGFNALANNDPMRPSVIIVARGGGSIEDLWEFNDEALVRAVAASTIPIISAVGHETDVTLIDFAADRRAPTPTAAAEFAVPVRAQLQQQVLESAERQHQAWQRFTKTQRQHLSLQARSLLHPRHYLALLQQRLDDYSERLRTRGQKFIADRRQRLQRIVWQPALLAREIQAKQERVMALGQRQTQAIKTLAGRRRETLRRLADMLQSVSYERTLERGYAVIFNNQNKPITSAENLPSGETVELRLRDGRKRAVVSEP